MVIDAWPRSAETWQRAKNSLGGGVSSGMRAAMKPHPLFFSRGSGPSLTDVDGNSYLDYVLGWGPAILGHGHEALADAVAEQARLAATFGAGHNLEFEVAERILERIPGAERVLWSNTGTEADQIALRFARAATGRNRFIKFFGHYHGWSDQMLLGYRPDADGSMLSAGTRGQHPASLDDVVMMPWGDLEEVAAALSDPASDFAAVFVEPVLCNSGVLMPPEGYLEGLRELCTASGTVLVFDEVITGFRIDTGGAVTRFGVTPDLVVLAKAVAGGLPLAAVVGKASIIDLSTQGVAHSGTYNGNPIVLAAAAATLDTLARPGTYDDFERRGRMLADGLRAACAAAGVTAHVNQVGPVVQCMLGVTKGDTFDDFLASDQTYYDHLIVEMLRRGLVTLPGGRWYISAVHSDEDIMTTVGAFNDALGAVIAAHGMPQLAAF